LDCDFPQYGFARHKGYATEFHLQMLEAHGPSQLHRLSFAPMRVA
jgi:ribonuclease HII